MLPVGALIPMNRLDVCSAQLDDFGWEVPDCVPGMLLSGRDRDVELTDLTQDAGRVSGCVCRGGCCAV